jgi:hypothetical protein
MSMSAAATTMLPPVDNGVTSVLATNEGAWKKARSTRSFVEDPYPGRSK